MALERFIPKSPDPFIRNSQDFEVAKFGHLNTIIEYVNSYVVTDSLQLAGSGPITSTARYITDSTGVNSAISIGTTRVGIGTDTPSAELHIDGHNGFGASLKITTNKVNSVAYVQMISDYVTGIEQYQYGGPGWGWPNWTTTRAGGTAAAPTAVPSNYGLNEYTFWGHDGTAGGQAYSMMTRTSETWTPTAHGIYTVFNTVATGSTSLVERMRFTGTGNITFNNASDTAKVAIKGSGGTSATTSFLVQNSSGIEALKVQDDNIVRTTYLGIGGGTSTNNIGGTHIAQFGNAVSSGDQLIVVDSSAGTKRGFKFGNQGTIRMALIQDGTDLQIGNFVSTFNPYVSFVYLTGNVGIGTTTPTARLQVQGSGSTNATTSLLVQNSGSADLLRVTDDGLVTGAAITSTGTLRAANNKLEIYNPSGNEVRLRNPAVGNYFYIGPSNICGSDAPFVCPSIFLNSGYIYGSNTGIVTNTQAYAMPTQLNPIGSANSCLINLNGGGRLQGSAEGQYIRVEGNMTLDGSSNKLKGFYFNPTLIGAFSPQNVFAIHSTYGGAYLNTATPQASAVLQADSTTQGFLPPRMTNAQRGLITTPAIGLIVYCTDTVEGIYVYKSTGWTFVA